MTPQPRDPLLTTARIIAWFFIGVLGLVAAVLLALVPAVVFKHDAVIAQLGASGVDSGGAAILAIVAVMLGVAALMGLAVWFFHLLLKIIDSVAEGDPFAPVNAVRLNRMAWISLGGYLATFPLVALIAWLAVTTENANEVQADLDIDGSLLVPLILFILARVFRHGAAMREDLEGTV